MRVVLFCLVFALVAYPQGAESELFGRVAPSARVTIQNVATAARFEVDSGPAGDYHFLGIPPGEYTLTIEKAGVKLYTRAAVVLRLASQTNLDVVNVSDDMPLLQTTSGSVSFSATKNLISTLPLDGRNFIPLVTLSPGVALPGGGSILPRINGSRPRTSEYIYDGISVLQPEPGQVVFYPIIDAMDEFKLNVNAYSPEYGRSNGGAIVVSGKSGTNSFHGTLFEFFRNEKLNARNYFAQPGPNPEFRRNQYGFTLGGPIRQNKTFFFIDFQGTRLRTAITRFSTVGVAPGYPAANRPGTANNYVRTAVEPDSQDQFDTRIDHAFNSKHRAFARYGFLRDDDKPVAPLPDGSGLISSGVVGHALIRGDSLASEYTWTPSGNLLNQLRFGYTRRALDQTPLKDGPISTVAGYQQLGPTLGSTANFHTAVTQLLDTFSLVKGRHTVKFGFDFRRESLDAFGPPNVTGTYTYTSLPNYLAGASSQYSIDIQTVTLEERADIAEFFLGDEWRATGRLTVNIGTRYTLNFPSYEKNGHGAVFNLNTEQLEYRRTARDLEKLNFGPRLGVAYRVSDSFVVRSGYGLVFFEQSGVTTPFTLPQQPFVSGSGVFATQRNNGSGYSQQWNITLQKTFGKNWSLETGYLGSKNTRLGLPEANINQVPFGQTEKPYPNLGAVALFRNNVGNSTYHAAQARLEKRFSHGLTINAAYTFSKLIDDASTYFSQTIFTGPVLNNSGAADAYNRHLEKDLSSGDIPRVFSAGWTYDLPRGWRIAGLVRVQSGDTVAITQAVNNNASLGYALQRPNRIGNPNDYSDKSAARWFDTAVFTPAPKGTIGTSSRNPVRGPGLQNGDLMLAKTLRIHEGLFAEFRAEAFNVSNTPPLNDPNGSFGSASFGTITSAGNPRDFELVLKIRF